MTQPNGMTAIELMDVLRKLPPETLIVLSKDSEGNGYSQLGTYDNTAHYIPETSWSGELWYEDDADEEDENGNPVPPSEAVKALVLWPVS